METISISPKFQVVIPKSIREALGLVSGQKMQALRYGDRVELIPLRPLAQARGFLAGINSDVERHEDRTDDRTHNSSGGRSQHCK